jgi:beta-glucosidase
LSYTTFAYANLRASNKSLGDGGTISVSVDVRNTGDRSGEEVVQLYVKHLNSSVSRPIQELKGFRRVALQPGEIKTVTLELKAAELAYWNGSRHKFVVESGAVQLMIGSSSADIRLKKTIKVAL